MVLVENDSHVGLLADNLTDSTVLGVAPEALVHLLHNAKQLPLVWDILAIVA